MNKIPTKKENPSGLHQRYLIMKITTNNDLVHVDPDSEYFVMRLDAGGKDPEHIKACRIGVNAYADAIAHHLPELTKDLKERYPIASKSELHDDWIGDEIIKAASSQWLDKNPTPIKESIEGKEEGAGTWVSVEDGLPIRPDKKIYLNVQCGYYTPKGSFIQFVGFYAEKHKVPYEDYDGDDGEYDPVEEAHGTLYLKPGWYELEETPGGQYDETFVQRKVTHWRPLFAPPESSPSKVGDNTGTTQTGANSIENNDGEK